MKKILVCTLVAMLIVLAACLPAIAEERSSSDLLLISGLVETLEGASGDSGTTTAEYNEGMDALIIRIRFNDITSSDWRIIKLDDEAYESVKESNNSLNEYILETLASFGIDDINSYLFALTSDEELIFLNVNGDDLSDYL